MPTPNPNDYLLKAIGVFCKMLAVVSPDRDVLASAFTPEKSGPGPIVGEKCYRVFFQRETPCENCGLDKVLQTGRPVIRPQAGVFPEGGLLLHHCIFPLPADDGPRSAVCVALDLPDQTAAIRQAGLSRAFLMSLLNNAADGIIAADRNGKIRIYNPAAEKIFGYPAAEALNGLDIRHLYPDKGAYEVMALLRGAEHGGPGKLEGHTLLVVNKQGRTVPIRLTASIVYEGGSEIATIGFFRDLRAAAAVKASPTAGQAVDFAEAMQQQSLGETIQWLTKALGSYDLKFGDAAVQAGLMTADQVARALEKQREIETKTQIHVPVGRVMIQLGMLTEVQRDALLALRNERPEAALPPPAVAEPETAPGPPSGKDAGDVASPPVPEETPQASLPADATGFRLEVSQDRLNVFLHRLGEAPLAAETILSRLAEEKIIEGVCDSGELAAYLEAEPVPDQPITVARGIAPEPGIPPEVRYYFDTDPLRIGTVREDGTIDWKDRGSLPRVAAGALLCEVVAGTEGRPGIDVYGNPIPAPRTDFRPPRCGKGVSLDDDGQRYLASIDGMVTLGKDLVLTVSRTLNIDGDVGLKTGHVDFDGHIEVTGTVQSGFRVYGHSLRADAIYGAEVHIAGDMTVQSGIFDSRIKCGGNLKAGHIHKTFLDLEGDLIVAREILDSEIETNGRLNIADGAVMASKISAKRGITVHDIGSEVARPSQLEVGVDHRLKRQMVELREQAGVLKKEIQQREAELAPLRLQAERIDTELGKMAEEQERLARKRKTLDEAMNQPEAKEHPEAWQRQRSALAAEEQRAEAAVERLMAEDAETASRISDTVREIGTARSTIEQLNQELLQVQNDLATKTGLAVLKASGLVTAGTFIEGPHASMTVKEDLKRVQILETKIPDENGPPRWGFKVIPLR